VDTLIFLSDMAYLVIILKKYRWDTFLSQPDPVTEARIYWYNYTDSFVNEGLLLWIIVGLMWIKAYNQFKWVRLTGNLHQILGILFQELITFSVFYLSLVFIFAIIGNTIFGDIYEFRNLASAMFTLFKATLQNYDIELMAGTKFGVYLGYVYFNTYIVLNVILFLNLIVAQLANAYKKLKKRGKVFYLLTTLSVREISEADDKYSSVISVFFPISTLNLIFGSIVLAAKSPTFNLVMLHIYFLPVMLVVLALFIAYQAIILPFAYLKVVGHKFALMVSGPTGSGSQTTLDRFGNAILFIIIGPILLTFSVIVDIFWFLAHVYKMDLDKTVSKKVFTYDKEEESLPLHRRTYKKMLMYFQTQNDQLVKLKDVSEDLRDYFDVFEGIRCMLYGKPDEIPQSKMGLYVAYSHFKRANKDDGVSNDDYFEVEKVAREYTTIKQVLLNNSIPVDIVSLESGLQKRKD
jgi:hypothetical protein